jgi:tetratricopeptide (TPR) repeat protein
MNLWEDRGQESRHAGTVQSPQTGSQRVDGRKGPVRAWMWKSGLAVLVAVASLACLAAFSDGFRAGIMARIAGSYSEQSDAYSFLQRHCDSSRAPSQALGACEKFAAMRPTEPFAHVLLGNAYAEVGRTGEAIDSYERAIALDPNCFDAYLGLGKAQSSRGLYAEAIESYHVALKIRPSSAELHLSLGLALSNSGRYEEAVQAFQKARELDPSISETQVLTGKAYLEEGMCAQAIECLEGAVAIEQGHAQAHYNLGRAYLRVGDKALAAEQQEVLQRLNPQLADKLRRQIER